MSKPTFRFKHFTIQQDRCALKVGTDGVLFGAWMHYRDAQRILDIGTGTGLLALIAAQRTDHARIDAVEIDTDSALQAAENCKASPWADRIRVHHLDVRRLSSAQPFDLILCNPPYYAGYSNAADERVGLAKHSAELRFEQLLEVVGRVLSDEGRFAVIVPLNREQDMRNEAHKLGLFPTRRCMVRYVPQRPAKRVLLEFSRVQHPLQEEELCVEASGPFDYSPAYRALISDLLPGH